MIVSTGRIADYVEILFLGSGEASADGRAGNASCKKVVEVRNVLLLVLGKYFSHSLSSFGSFIPPRAEIAH